MGWKQIHSERWERSDGAVVVVNRHTPWLKEWLPNCRIWMAWEPAPEERYLVQRSKRGLGWPRRWKTADSAMKAVDREYPEKQAVRDGA